MPSWDGNPTFEQLTLLIGWVDDRIIRRGVAGQAVPDVIEAPGVQVDLVYRRDVTWWTDFSSV